MYAPKKRIKFGHFSRTRSVCARSRADVGFVQFWLEHIGWCVPEKEFFFD
jgi:hypothetical protein